MRCFGVQYRCLFFYEFFVFLLALRARQNTAELVKIYSDIVHQNIS